MVSKISYNGKVYDISGSNFIRAVRNDPDFSFDRMCHLDQYFNAKGLKLDPFNLDQAKDLFLGIRHNDYSTWYLCGVLSQFEKYGISTHSVTREWVTRLKEVRVGKKSSNDPGFFKDFFGEQWEVAYQKCNSHPPNNYSVEYWVSKGLSPADAVIKIEDVKLKTAGTLGSFIRRYGDDGPSRYDDFRIKARYANSVDYYADRYGGDGGDKRSARYAQAAYKKTREFHESNGTIDKYLCTNHQRSKSNRYESLVIRHGEMTAREIVLKRAGFERTKRFKSSKEAFRFLLPIYKYLRRNGISRNDIMWGVGDQKEMQLYGSGAKFPKLYDFSIPKLKIVLEYNGHAWHPDVTMMTQEQLDTWMTPFGRSAQDQIDNDKLKTIIAEEHGYQVIPIWPLRDLNGQRNEIIEILKRKL